MNCRQCQQKLLHSLAAGDIPSAEVVAHESSCLACRKFHAAENNLFRSIDSGLRSLANQPVPRSFLPSLRVRLDEKFMANQAPFYRWGFTAVATAVILAISVALFLRRPTTTPPVSLLQSTLLASRSTENQAFASQPHQELRKNAPFAAEFRHTARAAASIKQPEVIVLAEEREAFAKFVAEVPDEPSVALAFAHPAPAATSDVVEIALLQIDLLEVKPLVSGATGE
jgi:hypothetical protein